MKKNLFYKLATFGKCYEQRTYIIHLPTQPLPSCSFRRAGSAVYCRQSGERLGESNVWKTKGVLSLLSLIHILCSQLSESWTLQLSVTVSVVVELDSPKLSGSMELQLYAVFCQRRALYKCNDGKCTNSIFETICLWLCDQRKKNVY